MPVELSQTALNGDVLTIERMAMSGNFCTLFYTVKTKEEMNPRLGFEDIISGTEPELWQSSFLRSGFTIAARGVEISENWSGQQFLADSHTLCGMERVMLKRPIEEGETYTLSVSPSMQELYQGNSQVPSIKWRFTLTAEPLETRSVELNPKTAVLDGKGNSHDIKSITISHSVLGTVIKLYELVPEDYREDSSQWPELAFVLRDGETGEYIPYSYVSSGSGGMRRTTYELYDVSENIESLELIPIRLGERDIYNTAALSDLPARSGNPFGGYGVSSVEIGKDKIIVTQHPMGATVAAGSGIDFLDADGKRIFDGDGYSESRVYADIFIDERDGSVITTYSLENVPQSDLERITQIRFRNSSFTLLEYGAVTIPLK